MAIRVRRPDTVRLPISEGDWLLVKKHLTAGEQRRMFARLMLPARLGEQPHVDPLMAGLAQVVEYLLDWSVQDSDGSVIPVKDQPAEVVVAALRAIDPECYAEIQRVIDEHDSAMKLERLAEKNAPSGERASSAISTSAA